MRSTPVVQHLPRSVYRLLPDSRLARAMVATIYLAFGLPISAAPAEPTAPAAPPPSSPLTGRPWQDMDYGPFLSASIEAPAPRTNIAFKGIAIRLPNSTGQGREAVLFDTDLLRYAAGWTGDFVALKGVVFDGEHWAYPAINGTQIFGNPSRPGWSHDRSFTDPRAFPYGPLPRDRAQWRGLHLHGNHVILSFAIAGTDILELPGVETTEKLAAFTRTIQIGPSAHDLTLQIAEDASQRLTFLDAQRLNTTDSNAPANALLVAFSGKATVSSGNGSPPAQLASGLVASWDFDQAQGDRAVADNANLTLSITGHQWASGHAGQGLHFSGSGRANLTPDPAIDFLQSDFSVAVWVKTAGDGAILSQTAPAGLWVPDGKALFIRRGRLCFDVGWVGVVESSQPVTPGQWNHIAMTWSHEDGQVNLFVNGSTDGPRPLRPRQAVPNEVLRIGFAAENFPAQPRFQGILDDLRLYRRTLTSADVAALAGVPVRHQGLLAGVTGLGPGARWIATSNSQLQLHIPARETPARLKVFLAAANPTQPAVFAKLLQASPALADLTPLTLGGPARWTQTVTTRGQRGADTAPFAVDVITWPDRNPWNSWMRFGGFDFFRDGTRAAITTWSGDVWIVSGIDDSLDTLTWRRFATGLYQPLGLKIVDDAIYVLGRDQITRLHDRNGDGEADFYECFNHDTMNTEHFHEFALDLQTDADGNFYYMKAARHAREALHPQHGSFMKVSRDGSRSEILANGFRAPNGLLITPNGDAFTTDQEGFWMPANRIDLLRPGTFHGNNWSWLPEGKRKDFDPPLLWVHPSIDRSPSTLAWVSSTQWAPLQYRLLSFSYGVGRIFLISTQWVDGLAQGSITPLPLEFDTGLMRTRFNPRDGQLYVCGLYGWAGNKTQPGGFHRIRRTAAPLQLCSDLQAAADGLVLRFLQPLDLTSAADPGNYSVQSWNYRWTENYGSPDYKRNGEKGRDRLPVTGVRVARDGRSVFLQIPSLTPAMQTHVQMNLRSADGTSLQTFQHQTIHRLDPRPGLNWIKDPIEPVAQAARQVLREEKPGLIQTFVSKAVESSDTRRARLAALFVPTGSPPTPFLAAGPFTTRWHGFIRSELRDTVQFSAEGRGTVALRINGSEVLSRQPLTSPPSVSTPFTLQGDLNAIELDYECPPDGDAILRLYWEGENLVREPLPPGVFVHEAADPSLRLGQERRLGRQLFADRYCSRCHEVSPALSSAVMPQLLAQASNLDQAGRQFHPAWIAKWLLAPNQVIPEARMPSLLHGTSAERQTQANDLAAFLATLGSPSNAHGLSPASAQLVQRGADTFSTLGCVACHLAPGTQPLPDDPRRTLAHVRAKWQPAALVAFLQRPEENHPWTRMPNLQLIADEALALTAFLADKSPAPEPAPPGNPQRGRQLAGNLGCANCHTVTDVPKRTTQPTLAGLIARLTSSGCLADAPERRGAAPDFELRETERLALSRFLESDTPALRRGVGAETSESLVQSLRCTACHQREDAADFWSKLEAADPNNKTAANPYDDDEPGAATIHRQRPPLTLVGEKLRPEWMDAFIAGRVSYRPRPKLPSRMPAFPAYASALATGLAEQHGFSPTSPTRASADPQLSHAGSALIRKGALACVDCHAVGSQPALAGTDTVTINFAYIPERLTRHYYDRYLQDPPHVLPGTMMPRFMDDKGRTGMTSYFEGDARQQFNAIWHFMLTLDPPAPAQPPNLRP